MHCTFGLVTIVKRQSVFVTIVKRQCARSNQAKGKASLSALQDCSVRRPDCSVEIGWAARARVLKSIDLVQAVSDD